MHTKNLNSLPPNIKNGPRGTQWLIWGILSSLMAFLPLFNAWTGYFIPSGPEGMMAMIGGVLPYSDASGYWEGALRVLHRGFLDEWSMRRPLNALFFAFRLGICGGNVWGAFLIQSAFFATALMLYFVYMGRILGKWPTFIAALVLFEYSFQFTHTTLSEILGLTLGLVSFIFLWGGWLQNKRYLFFMGLGTLTIALSCRAGPHMILPALLLLLLVAPFTHRRYRDFFWACVVVFGCFVVMSQIPLWYKDVDAGGQFYGNFSYTLFGLVSGGKTWLFAYQDPHMSQLIAKGSEGEVANILYKASLDVFLENPFKLVRGLVHNLGGYIYWILRTPERIFRLSRVYAFILSVPFVTYVLWRFWCHYRIEKRAGLFLCFAGMGILGSASVVWVDGGMRTFAVALPFVGAIVAYALSNSCGTSISNKALVTGSGLLVMGMVGGALISPWIKGARSSRLSADPQALFHREEGTFVIKHPSSQPYVIIEKKPRSLQWHRIGSKKFSGQLVYYEEAGKEIQMALEGMGEETMVLSRVYDYQSKTTKLIFFPLSLFEASFSQGRVRVTQVPETQVFIAQSIIPLEEDLP